VLCLWVVRERGADTTADPLVATIVPHSQYRKLDNLHYVCSLLTHRRRQARGGGGGVHKAFRMDKVHVEGALDTYVLKPRNADFRWMS